MFDCGCHDNDTSDALNMAFFVHSPSKPTTTQKNNGAFKNLFPTLLHCLQESLLTVEDEEEQLAAALKESNLYLRGTQTKPSATITRATLSTSEGNDDNERTELNDAANALLNLSELSSN